MATAVIMPKFEMAQETGTVLHWLKQEGDLVHKGDPILEVETDKVTMEVEAPDGGILRGISADSGDVVPIGQPIAYLVKPGEDWSPPAAQGAIERTTTRTEVEKSEPQEELETLARATPVAKRMARAHGLDLQAVTHASGVGRVTKADVSAYLEQQTESALPQNKVMAVPAARRLARELGLALEAVSGSGPGGRIQSEDVRRAVQQEAEASQRTPIRRVTPLSGMRRTIARRMTDSVQQIPQFTASVDVVMSRALAIVADLNGDGDKDRRISLTAFLIKACAWTLRHQPRVNVSYDDEQIVEWADVNVGVAVALDEGLIVPVLRQADQKGIRTVAGELDDLVARARARELTAADLQDGTFTISNLGMFGVDRFTAIVNPPQAAILAVGRVRKRPQITEQDQIVIEPQATFTLTADHRALDGAIAARFLATLQNAIEHPGLLLS